MRYLFFCLTWLIFFSPINVQAADTDVTAQGRVFIDSLAKRAIGQLGDKTVARSIRETRFRTLLEENFDIPNIARFVLGPPWREATPAQQQEFTKLFNEMVVGLYMAKMDQYQGQTLKTTGARSAAGGRFVMVSSQVYDPLVANLVNVVWRLVNQGSGKFKVADVTVENISMSLSQRAEFTEVLEKNGGKIEALLAEMRLKKPLSGGAFFKATSVDKN